MNGPCQMNRHPLRWKVVYNLAGDAWIYNTPSPMHQIKPSGTLCHFVFIMPLLWVCGNSLMAKMLHKKPGSLFLVRHFYFCAPGMITDRNTGECLFYDFTCQKPAKPEQQGCWNQICIVHCRAIYCQSFILLPKSLTISLS